MEGGRARNLWPIARKYALFTPSSQSNDSTPAAATNTDCNDAVSHTNQAFLDFNSGDYSGGYENATIAVHLADSCTDASMPATKGFALSARAFNEHHLIVGDATTDLNQAEQLLSECQTQPGYYGTHDGAACETKEQNNISTKTNWDMQRYENQ